MATSGDRSTEFRYWLGVALEQSARRICAEWLDEARRGYHESSSREFPVQVLSDHVASLLQRLFFAVATGRDVMQDPALVAEITSLARFRRRHGYTSDEVAGELRLLTQRVFETACLLAEDGPSAAPSLVLEVAEQLRNSLSALSRVTLEAYRTGDREDQRAWASLQASFSRTIIHELRNRLSAATLRAELAVSQGGGVQASLDKALDLVSETVEDVSLMVMSRCAAEELERRTMPLGELVGRVLEDLSPLADKSGIDLEPLPSLPSFHVDASKTYLVVLNMLGSAVKNAKMSRLPGSVAVHAEPLHDASAWCIEILVGRRQARRVGSVNARARPDSEPAELPVESAIVAAARRAAALLGGGLWVNGDQYAEGPAFSLTVPEPPGSF